MNETLSAEKFRAAGLEKKVFTAIAGGYAGKENVLHFEPNLSPAGVRELADAISLKCAGIAAVFSGEDSIGYNMCLISQSVDVRSLGAQLTSALNGRGGGKPNAFQGSVKSTREQIIAAFCAVCQL